MEENTESEFAISLSIGSKEIAPQVDRILEVCEKIDVSPIVVLAGHYALDPMGSEKASETAKKYPGIVFPALAETGTFSMAYLKGWQVGAELAENVISLDADGSHDPMQILDFIEALRSGYKAVMGSRNLPGSKNNYPLQRRLISKAGTTIANLLLNPNHHNLTDFTSGFEGLKSSVISKVLENSPIEQWICATHGPYHLQNTELRMKLLKAGVPIHELPITYGTERKGKNLKVGYIFQAMIGLTLLLRNE